ncbi:hypothetical protein GQX74_010545 [Glossina fuscipes]|nr:hypothetical protein GQX74_010545 [Glossina fuscipes]
MSDDEFAVCPYNNAHRVLRIRMPSHIIKCRKNYKGPQLEQCAYNATHLVPAVNNNSKALANDLSIEFMYFKKKLVTKPIAALFTTIINTLKRNIASKLFNVKAASSWPCKSNMKTLQAIESTYIKTFCTNMFTSTPLSLKSSDCGWAAKIPLSSLTLVRNELKFNSFNIQPIQLSLLIRNPNTRTKPALNKKRILQWNCLVERSLIPPEDYGGNLGSTGGSLLKPQHCWDPIPTLFDKLSLPEKMASVYASIASSYFSAFKA